MKRLSLWFALALIPVVLLGFLAPDRLLGNPQQKGDVKYTPSLGADIVAFVGISCPHCTDFQEFANNQRWEVNYKEISQISVQQEFDKLQDRVPSLNQGIPTIYLNGHVIQGYETHETTGKRIKNLYEECKDESSGCLPFKEFTKSNVTVELESATQGICLENCEESFDQYIIDIWLIGEVDLTLLSLPTLSILLGFLDGFNPCAMWVLITLLTLLINTHDKKKIWVVGGTFLFFSGAVYYLFIAAWLNVFLLIGFNTIVQKIIGLVAVLGGGFYLYEAFGKNPNECKVTNAKQRQKTMVRMRKVLDIAQWPVMIFGVSILAVSVNMIELVCTAGLPAIFTQILAFNDVSTIARYGYIGLFILLYMIDDIVIFAIAVYTLQATGMTTKYQRFTLIFGGLLMYGLGMLLIFAPEILMFG
ncbi:MAG: hypothetical protein KAS32_26885 [Candidatus Peribacteraceae bacterium]|nr:hypothetical protein [Candidatus Peribacteraceae bacterium]